MDADEWARAEAMPSDNEITRVRRLIERMKGDMDDLTGDERGQIDEAVAVVRQQPVQDHHPGHAEGPPAAARHPGGARRVTGAPMIQGRQADSARRRQRVIKAINETSGSGGEISVSAIARTAGVDRTFLYRHPDLLAQVHCPGAPSRGGERRSRRQPGLAPGRPGRRPGQVTRQAARIRQLETKLSQMLGEQAWRESGLGAPDDIDKLKRRITELEQQAVDLTRQLEERDEELAAARAANREMIAQLNVSVRRNARPGREP